MAAFSFLFLSSDLLSPDKSKEGGIRLIVGALGQSPADRVQRSVVGRSLPSDMRSCVASIYTTKPVF